MASKVLGIVLTKRGAGSTSETELAGFPHHSIENYLPKLVKAGNRVAICDQLEDPKLTKKIVKRGGRGEIGDRILPKGKSEERVKRGGRREIGDRISRPLDVWVGMRWGTVCPHLMSVALEP